MKRCRPFKDLESNPGPSKSKFGVVRKEWKVSRLRNIVRFDGTVNSNGAHNYSRLEAIAPKVAVKDLSIGVSTRLVGERLTEEIIHDGDNRYNWYSK